jgi:hypothetical protein
LRSALARLTARLADQAAQDVTYTRGAESIAVKATLGRKLLKLWDDVGNVHMEMTDMDFLIPSAGFILEGGQSLPKRGDLVTLPINGQNQIFEVLPYGADPPWTWADPNGQTMMRIHTKLTSVTSGTLG